MMNRIPIIFLLFLFLIPLSGCEPQTADGSHALPSLPKVEVYTVKSEVVPLIRELPGRTAAFNVAEVRPQVNGIVLKRLFEEGSLVKEGQSLYEIDDAVYQAHYAKAMAQQNNMEQALKRAEKLKDSRAMSEQDYEDLLYALEQAKADVELSRLELNYCRVKAPLSGKIGRSMITVGALVTNGQGQELAVIQQLDPIYVDLNPAVKQLLRMGEPANETEDRHAFWQGATVTLTLEDGSRYPHPGKITFLDNQVRQDTGTVTLRAEFPNPGRVLLPGMSVRTAVEIGLRQDGKLIPQQGLLRDMKGNPYVWVVCEGNRVSTRNVKVNCTLGNAWLVDSGLENGDRVVIEGLQFIAPDVTVTATESAMELDFAPTPTSNVSPG